MADELHEFYRKQGRPLHESADLSQDVALDIIAKFEDAPEDPALFRSRVERFANMAVQARQLREQRHERKRHAVRDHPRTPARRPDSQVALRRLLARIRAELSKLPSSYRNTLLLLLDRDKPAQVAEELDIPDGTMRRRLWEVRRDLNAAMARRRRTNKRYRS